MDEDWWIGRDVLASWTRLIAIRLVRNKLPEKWTHSSPGLETVVEGCGVSGAWCFEQLGPEQGLTGVARSKGIKPWCEPWFCIPWETTPPLPMTT